MYNTGYAMPDDNGQMKRYLQGLDGVRQKLLLHACCAVCAGGVLARKFEFEGAKRQLTDFFDVTLFFYNPNIDTKDEYEKRAGELEKLQKAFPIRESIILEYDPRIFLDAADGLAAEPEGGARCEKCISLRVAEAARYANERGFDCFSTTLTVSPHKNAATVNAAGKKASTAYDVAFLPADFKKEGGFLAATATATALGVYRQNYCGCLYGREAAVGR